MENCDYVFILNNPHGNHDMIYKIMITLASKAAIPIPSFIAKYYTSNSIGLKRINGHFGWMYNTSYVSHKVPHIHIPKGE